ncbi:MAG: glycosyltransferase family 41 protein [Burkholderiaceae bacterium]|nr:MAG: glycosyltransferase family 41 protein [Burkholderiaceae bacterium]
MRLTFLFLTRISPPRHVRIFVSMWKSLKSLFSHNTKPSENDEAIRPAPSTSSTTPTTSATAEQSISERANQLIDAGNALEEQGKIEQAAAQYEAARQLAPQFPRAHLNLGNLQLLNGDAKAALLHYEEAARLDPNYAAAHFNRGNALFDLVQLSQAELAYRQAIKINPDFIDAYVALGAVLDQQQSYDAAIAVYRQVLEKVPNYARVHTNLALALQKKHRFLEALSSLRHALNLNPQLADTHVVLANALKDLGRVSEAEPHYRQALALQPQHWDAYNGLLFALNYRPEHPPEVLFEEARQFGIQLAQAFPPQSLAPTQPKVANSKLRIGFVSGDLRNHPVGYFLDSVITALRQHHPDLELIAFSTYDKHSNEDHSRLDELGKHFREQCHQWHAVASLLPTQLEDLVRRSQIDVLIDLAGHNGFNRLSLFSRRCAPVQVTWLGYFATTGLSSIDYLIADPHTLPPDQEVYFTEKIWRLPETRLCFSAPRSEVAVSSLPALTKGYVTFACFNHLAKMNDEVVALWSRVLTAVEDSRLLLKSPPLVEAQAQQETLARFAAHGIAAERIIFSGISSRDDYFRAYHEVDICLDPFPYTGGTTTMESLWMGVPVISLSGRHFLARQGQGLLINAGLSAWVAEYQDDYVALAVHHSQHLEALAQLRAGLRQQIMQSPIGDARNFAEHFASAMRQMNAIHQG